MQQRKRSWSLVKNYTVTIPAGGSGGVQVATAIPQTIETARATNLRSLSPFDKVQMKMWQQRREVSKNKLKKVLLDLDREDVAQLNRWQNLQQDNS